MLKLGKHIIMEMYDCEADIDNEKEIEEMMVNATLVSGAEVREVIFHKFAPHGVSGVVVISESHLTIHTWPEYKYCAVDIFTCGNKVNPYKAMVYLVDMLKPQEIKTQIIDRGIDRLPDRE